jgi:hypothetical protein
MRTTKVGNIQKLLGQGIAPECGCYDKREDQRREEKQSAHLLLSQDDSRRVNDGSNFSTHVEFPFYAFPSRHSFLNRNASGEDILRSKTGGARLNVPHSRLHR